MAAETRFVDFVFDDEITQSTFRGEAFYNTHKGDPFLADTANVLRVLSSGKKMKEALKTVDGITLSGWKVYDGTDLLVCNGARVVVADLDYTLSRLQGMCAAIVAANLRSFPDVVSANAAAQGFAWIKNDADCVKAYLSFTPGAEHFCGILGDWPIVATCYLVKNQKLSAVTCKRTISMKRTDGSSIVNTLKIDKAKIKAVYTKMLAGDVQVAYKMRTLIANLFD